MRPTVSAASARSPVSSTTGGSGLTQAVDHAGSVGPDHVLEEERADRPSVDRGEDRHRPVETGAPPYPPHPVGARLGDDPVTLAERDLPGADPPAEAVAVDLADVLGGL